MPCLEGMHAPGSETAHLLPAAGIKSQVGDMYRFHRVIPYYPPDPCIRPHNTDLICPPTPAPKNNADMPPAGVSTAPISDRFAFYKAREGSSRRPCHPGDGSAMVAQPCPGSNSDGYPLGRKAGNIDLRYQGIPSRTNSRQQQVAEDPDCQSSMSSGRSKSACWPMPGLRGVLSGSSTGGNGRSHSQTSHLSSQSGQTVEGHHNPTPYSAQRGHPVAPGALQTPFSNGPYAGRYNSHPYICRPVYDRRYLQDCPQQDGPPADSYTFL